MFEKLRELCIANGIAVTDLCKQITGSSGNLPTWKKGNIKADTLVKIADYFNISVDYLLGRTDDPKAITQNNNSGNIVNGRRGRRFKSCHLDYLKSSINSLKPLFMELFFVF